VGRNRVTKSTTKTVSRRFQKITPISPATYAVRPSPTAVQICDTLIELSGEVVLTAIPPWSK
jgi:hypothetical protein